MVVNDTTVRTYRNVNTRFFKISITFCANVDKRSCLTTADTFSFTCDTNRTTTDTNFNKVCATVSKESKACSVNYVTSTDFYAVAVIFSYPSNSSLLPFRKTFRRVDTKNVYACFNKRRDSFCIVSSVDTCTNNVTL